MYMVNIKHTSKKSLSLLIFLFAILYEDISAFLSGSSSAFGDLFKWLGLSDGAIQAIRDTIKDLGSAISNAFGFAIYFVFLPNINNLLNLA